MTKHLYNPKDVTEVRKKLLKEQDNLDPVTGYPLEFKDSVTDHDHDTQFVRAVIHRQVNSFIGKLENNFTRMIKWWYTGTLSEFLRQCADYLEKDHPTDYLHPAWLKKCQTQFNKLPEGSKRAVLSSLGQVDGRNGTERKTLFRKALLKREHTFEQVMSLLQEHLPKQ
jgi:hypothetical protein